MGTAVGAADQSMPFQQAEIAPHGLLGDTEAGCEFSDIHGSGTACRFQNSASSFFGVHGDTFRFNALRVAKFLQGECAC